MNFWICFSFLSKKPYFSGFLAFLQASSKRRRTLREVNLYEVEKVWNPPVNQIRIIFARDKVLLVAHLG